MSDKRRPRGLLPPGALRLSLLAQIPGIVVSWPLHPPIEAMIVAGVLVLLALLLNLAAAQQFSRRGIGIVPFSESPELALKGPFRLTRNPMYVGLVAFSAALSVGTGVWFNLVAPALLAFWLHVFYVLPEERFLRERFGEAFDVYARRVPRWL